MNAIETKKLTKFYGAARGIVELELTVREGEFFGFIGPNGAGKSTLIRTLLGLISPTSGEAAIFGHDIRKENKKILDGKVFKVVARGGADGRLYGAVTAQDISDSLKKEGFDIDKKKVVISNPIKNTGMFKTRVKLHPQVSADINVEVVTGAW